MPKKAPKSGYYYFMLDYKQKQEKMGEKFPNGLRDVQLDSKCGEAWNKLNAEEKARYNRRAKDTKRQGKLTSAGESVELLEKQRLEQLEYEATMKDIIDKSVEQADKIGNLDTLSFYFIHVNHFYTQVKLDENWTDYFPAEYAVIEFSLKNGVKRIHHQIIKAEIQPGYTREYIEHSDSTHKLSNNLAQGETDYSVMYHNLVKFLKPDSSSNKLPPLYTVKRMMTIVPCLLARMAAAVDVDVKTFDLYSLEYLFGTLMAEANNDFPESGSRAILAAAHLDKDSFLWTSNIECDFHKGIEGTGPYCSQSIVQQWAFTIADYCCPRLSIELKPGVHCPSEDLSAAIAAMRINQSNAPLSKTGGSAGYGRIARNCTKEDERRKIQNPLKIIDYGKNPRSSANDHAEISTEPPPFLPTRKPRVPKTMATVFASSDEVPLMNDDNFPAIGGRGKPRLGKADTSKPTAGRGRGAILMN